MVEFVIKINKIKNGLIVTINNEQYYFRNSWGLGKYIQEELEKSLDKEK